MPDEPVEPGTEPGPGQESVWDYPRPPAVVKTERHLVVEHQGVLVAETREALKVMETSSPPTYYFAARDVNTELLRRNPHRTLCEWKGRASYYDLVVEGAAVEDVAWSYPDPTPDYRTLRGRFAFYPQKLDCSVDGEHVVAQKGAFYGGWITSDLVGPFKGGPDSGSW